MRTSVAYLLLLLTFSAQGDEIPHAIIQTNLGIIEVKLNPEKAPETVENFLTYIKEGFYENTIFHRVVSNFIIQGGGYTIDYQKKPTQPSIPNEASNGLKNLRGTIAMARTADPNSSTSQFFINVRDNKFLDYKSSTPSGWGYCVFGKVVDGMDVVDKIARLPTDAAGPFRRDVPQTPVIIEAIKIEYVPVTGEETSSNDTTEEQPSEETSAPANRQKKNASNEKAKTSKQATPSFAEMQQEMLKDLEDMEDESEESSAKGKKGLQKEETTSKKEETVSKSKEVSKSEESTSKDKEVLSSKEEVSSEKSQNGEGEKNKIGHNSEDRSLKDDQDFSQKETLKEESSLKEPKTDKVKVPPTEEKLVEKETKEQSDQETARSVDEESEQMTHEQDVQESVKDQKPSLKYAQKEPDPKEENKTMLSVTAKKETSSPSLKKMKKAGTPPDPPTLPDKPEPPMN